MRIEEIDKNLVVDTNINKEDIVWLSPKEAPFKIYGLCNPTAEDTCYRRMPKDIAEATNEGVAWLHMNTAGGRIRFKTNSPYIAIKTVMYPSPTMPHIAKQGQSGFDLYRQPEGGKSTFFQAFQPPTGETKGYESVKDTDGQMYTYTIHMPLYDVVNELYIGLSKDADLLPPVPYTYEKPVLYYGSSITQGGCASRPGTCYQALISQKYDCDHINLGFSGSGRAEPIMNEYLASLDVSVFVCDYDHNAPNTEHLQATHEPLYRTYRAKNPTTPIIFISRPDTDGSDTIPNRNVILATYQKALEEGDKNVYFLDGSKFFECEFGDNCTVDGAHPTDFGFMRMASCIGPLVGKLLEEMK